MTSEEVSPFKALDFIRDNAKAYAHAKADVIYMTEFRKSLKAILMAESDAKTESAKETFAYSDDRYIKYLNGLRTAIATAEEYRWKLIAAQAKIEVWRSLESSARAEGKATQ